MNGSNANTVGMRQRLKHRLFRYNNVPNNSFNLLDNNCYSQRTTHREMPTISALHFTLSADKTQFLLIRYIGHIEVVVGIT